MNTKPLLAALDDGYRHEPHQMLTYFLSSVRQLWKLPGLQEVPKEVAPAIGEAVEEYGRLVAAAPPFTDILGPVYMELRSRGSKQALGQFFTPWPIASMMARMTAGTRPATTEGPLFRVCDPACGSGVMLLAFINTVLTDWGPDYLRRISVTGCDLDSFCAQMTMVQLLANCSMHDLVLGEVVVLRGNSLGPFENLETVLHANAPEIVSTPAQSPARLHALAGAARTHPDLVQLDLFEAA